MRRGRRTFTIRTSWLAVIATGVSFIEPQMVPVAVFLILLSIWRYY